MQSGQLPALLHFLLLSVTPLPSPLSPPTMPHFTPLHKHSILTHVKHKRKGETLASIASLHGVKGGARTLQRWLRRWKDTADSLQRRAGSGRPTLLTPAQVTKHVRSRIQSANRSARAVHYPSLLPLVQQATGRQFTLRTLQRYGKQQLHVRQKKAKKRTANECKSVNRQEGERGKVCVCCASADCRSLHFLST